MLKYFNKMIKSYNIMKTDKPKSPTTGANAIKGVTNFLVGKKLHQDDTETVVLKYMKDEGADSTLQGACEYIQLDFGKFVKWFKENYK